MGLGAMKLADMETYIEVVLALLRNETIEADVEGKRKKLRFLIQMRASSIPVIRSRCTSQPTGLSPCFDSAKLGAGWVNFIVMRWPLAL